MEYVGKAFRCNDGTIRWAVHLSKRGLLHLLWLDEQENVWYSASKMSPRSFGLIVTEEVDSPKGKYLRCGATGVVQEYSVN